MLGRFTSPWRGEVAARSAAGGGDVPAPLVTPTRPLRGRPSPSRGGCSGALHFIHQFRSNLCHVAAKDGREIAVDHGGIAAANELDQRRNFVTSRHLREAELAGERRHAPLVIAVAV